MTGRELDPVTRRPAAKSPSERSLTPVGIGLLWITLCVSLMTACQGLSAVPSGAAARVICLTPSTTEIVATLGAVDRLVGVDQYSQFPASVRDLPKVGDFLQPNLEAILSLRPDVVLIDQAQEQRVVPGLKGAPIRVVSLRMHTVEDVRQALRIAGEALGRQDQARGEIARLDAELAAVAASVKPEAARRVLFVVDRRQGSLAGMVAAGPDTYIDELLRRAGAVNVLASSSVRYAQISPETVISLAPDVIFDAAHVEPGTEGKAVADWAALSTVPAVKSGRVHVLADPIFVTPGPRLGAALRRIAELL
jgi:iron complex transport system substrate-binding protein